MQIILSQLLCSHAVSCYSYQFVYKLISTVYNTDSSNRTQRDKTHAVHNGTIGNHKSIELQLQLTKNGGLLFPY
jgi:hypothetical protein